MSHGDRVTELPDGFVATAASANSPYAAMSDESRRYYGVQFHPEVTHTLQGARLLERFVREICACDALWSVGNIIEDSVRRVRAQVGDGKVLLGLSGGVDSSVVAALLHLAHRRPAGVRIRGSRSAATRRGRPGDAHLRAEPRRASHPRGCRGSASSGRSRASPIRRRSARSSAGCSSRCSRRKSNRLEDVGFLAQGTIYPDVIESAGTKTGKAHVIKSHHNVGGLPAHMKLQLVEPLRELFKDEVRRLGAELGPAARHGLSPSVPGSRPGRAHPG